MTGKAKKKITFGVIVSVIVGLTAIVLFAEKINYYAKDKYIYPIVDKRIDSFFTKNCTLPFDKIEVLYRFQRDKAKNDSIDSALFNRIIDEVYAEKDSKVPRLK